MLYLNSIENAEASPTEKKYAICHEEIPSMLHIPELAPSRELLTQWESKEISWEEFRERFTDEMRVEYRKEESRLKGLIKYTLESDVTLHSPEPNGERTYRAILEGIINVIFKSQGQTGHVTNLAPEPVEESQPQEDIANLFGNTLHELNLTKSDNTRLLRENDELQRQIDQLKEKINTHEATIADLRRTLLEKEEIISNQENEIQSLNNTIGEANKERDRLNRKNRQLEEQAIAHSESIRTRDDKIQSLNDKYKELEGKLPSYYNQKIKDIAVKATRDNPVAFDTDFSTLVIDSNLPTLLRTWLEKALRINQNSQSDLYHLIREHTDFNAQHTLDGKFDRYDVPLADVIRMQRNLIAHPERMDEKTKMARVYCCFFAAALLSPKLSQSDYTSETPKSIKPKRADAKVHYNHGIAYRKKGDYDSAIAEYTKAIELKPDFANAYNNRGNAYSSKSDYNRAIADYTKAIELKSDFTNAYYNRGTAYYRENDYIRAIADLTRAIELKPDYANAYNNRGEVYRAKGDPAYAQADFYKAKQLQK